MKRRTEAKPSPGALPVPQCAVSTADRGARLCRSVGESSLAAGFASPSWRIIMLATGIIVLAGLAAYHNSFAGVFVYDDIASIVENPTIRRLWPIWRVLSPPCDGETVGGRPLLNVSLAINYALGGLDVWGYHAVNLAIHIMAALLLFGLLRRTFLTRTLRDRFGRARLPLALASTLVWMVHPLQTESVTYIVQRAESLMGFFYLLTLYALMRSADSARPRFWHALAVCACLLGMATKEVMVTAPLMALLYDRTFLAGSFREALRRRWRLYTGLAATWGLLAYLVLSTGLIGRQTELGAPDLWTYTRTQPCVILHYLRLSLWPTALCFDYAWPAASTLGEILPGAVVLGLLVAVTFWGLVRRKGWSYLGAWFFLILAPTSSVLPLAEMAYEHRMYLPLAAIVLLVVAGGYAFWEALLPRQAEASGRAMLARWTTPMLALAAVLLALGNATVVRNRDYRSSLSFWKDTADKRPSNFVTHNGLGLALVAVGRTDEAVEQFNQALLLKPEYAHAHNNLGNALARMGRADEAIEHYRQALRLKPEFVEAHNSFGLVLAEMQRAKEAVKHYQEALRLKPHYAAAHYNFANVLAGMGKREEAIQHYYEAVKVSPDFVDAHNNLAIVLASLDRTDEAVGHFEKALHLNPDCAVAHHNLAMLLANTGRTKEGIEHYYEAVRLMPRFVTARHQLARILATAGRTKESLEQYNQVLQLMPDSLEALHNLAWLLATHEPAEGGDPARAVELAQRARELGGQENAQCLDTLAAAYAAAGRFDDAILIAQRAAQLAQSAGQAALAKNIQSRLELYRAGRPYRETAHSSQP